MAKVKDTDKPASKKPASGAPSALSMMNALPDPVIAFDELLKVVFSNHAAQEFFQLSEKQMLTKFMVELLGNENVVFESVETVVRKSKTITLHDVSVKERPVSSVILTMVEQESLYLMVIRRQQIQLSNEWNEKTMYSLKSTQMVAQMLAHEIKNPLAGIRGAAQLLEKSELSDEDKELAKLIENETVRIQGLVEKFNIFNETPDDQYQAVNLHEVLNHVAKLARATYGKNIQIKSDFDPSLPNIKGHFDHLVQAKLNLIKNAAEAFKNKKGKISIRTFYDNAAGFHPERPEKLPLCIEIEDDGQGITPEMLKKIFQPYFSTKPNGQGLGLPIVSKIVDNHGGVIKVSSKPGKTVFRINLPMSLNPTIKK